MKIQECYYLDLNYKDKKFSEFADSVVEGLFQPFLVGAIVILVLIGVFGVFSEWKRRTHAHARGRSKKEVFEEHALQG